MATTRKKGASARTSASANSRSDTVRLAFWLALSALVIVFDQFTKWLIVGNYQLGDATRISGFFNIVRAHNTGAAFSLLATAGGWQRWLFAALALGASALIVWLLRGNTGRRLYAFGLSMILGGAVGNLLDRIVHGYVVDFLDFHFRLLSGLFHHGHFPAFNVADIAISAGVAAVLLHEVLAARKGGG